MMKRRKGAALLGIMCVWLIFGSPSCKKKEEDPIPPPSPGANEVWIQSSAFSPASITVAVNTTVTWTNLDGIPHTVTGTIGSFGSSNLPNNGTYSFLFTTAGTYPYKCSIHPVMTGEVIVQ